MSIRALSEMENWISSHPQLLLCKPKQDYTVKGKLLYQGTEDPMIKYVVKMYANNQFGFKHLIGTAKTDNTGAFTHHYTWNPSQITSSQYITAEVFKRHYPYKKYGIRGPEALYKVKEFKQAFYHTNTNDTEHNMGTHRLQFKEAPIDITIAKKLYSYEYPKLEYFWRLIKSLLPQIIKSFTAKILLSCLSTEKVQRIFNSFGPQFPKTELDGPSLLNEFLNGLCSDEPVLDAEGNYNWSMNWDGSDLDIPHSMPNLNITYRKDQNNKLFLTKITVKFREDVEPRVIPFNEGFPLEKWAIYHSLSAGALKGEINNHLGTHLFAGTIANEFDKSISEDNPLCDLVKPFLANIDFINHFGGNGVIFGQDSILGKSALTDDAVGQALINRTKEKADYNIPPPDPIPNENHQRAVLTKEFYNTYLNYFLDFFDQNSEQLESFKSEIFQWSDSLYKHYQRTDSKESYFPPIMSSENQFGPEGKLRLARCLAHLLNEVTYVHWSFHTTQQILTHLDVASLSIRDYGLTKEGIHAPFGNTTPADAIQQLSIAHSLMSFKSLTIKDYAPSAIYNRLKDNPNIPNEILEQVFCLIEI